MSLRKVKLIPVAAFLLLSVSCSTTRVLSEGEYRLASNDVEINHDSDDLDPDDILQYVKQQPNRYFIFGWNPFLNIYNWQNGKGRLFDRIFKKLGTPPVVHDPALAASSCDNIRKHLEYLGYYGSRVGSRIDTVRRLAHVNYLVTPGTRIRIDSIAFEIPSNADFVSEFEADSLNRGVRAGDWLSEKALEAESARGAAYFRELGYYDFNKFNYFFVADTLTDRTLLRYQIKEYTRNNTAQSAVPVSKYHIGDVSILHTDDVVFREDILKNLNTIHPGDLYSASAINVTYNRMSSLKVFNNVSIEMTPRDSSIVDCSINLSGTKLQGFKADLEASTNSSGLIGISPQLSVYHKNIFHGGEWLTLGFTGNFQFKPGTDVRSTELGANAGLSLPRFLGLPYGIFKGSNIPRTEIKASFNYQDRPEYLRNIAGLSFGYSGQIAGKFFYQFYPLQATFVKLYDLDEHFAEILARNPYMRDSYKNHLDAGLGSTVYHTTDSDIVPKTAYRYSRFSFDLSGNLLSLFSRFMNENQDSQAKILGVPFTQYVRGQLDLGKVFRWGRTDGNAMALHFVTGAGFAYGNSTALPFEKQFYAGGAGSMRGWQVRSLGPGASPADDSFSIPSQTGDFKMEIDAEYRFRMFWKLEGALFAEAGNVWNMNDISGDFLKTLAADWGLGLRVDLNFILLRLDTGFKVYDPTLTAGDRFCGPDRWFSRDGFAVHFGVGYPF